MAGQNLNLMHHRVPERADDGIESLRASSISDSCSSFNSSMLQSAESGSQRYLSGTKKLSQVPRSTFQNKKAPAGSTMQPLKISCFQK